MRALLVEDDPAVADDVARGLRAAGFIVDHRSDGATAWFDGDVEDYDVAVVDLGLPHLDGISVIRRWREAGRAFPILILSARHDWTDKVTGIEAGADDYLSKPYEMGELIARVRGLVRRAAGRTQPVLRVGALSIDTLRMTVAVNGAPARLSPLEFRFLDYLGHNLGRAVSAGEIADHLYGTADASDTNAIEALVTRLRRKIGAEMVETRRGFGYLLPSTDR